ncbi:MAG: HD domain-containing response regulator [Deltaproteobacteria bacterium]|nr:HD domain-containing response regulator [Deltaproteobacteria bacterium]MBW2082702.1 HD domain-containing response regulator [Deltaproteobacteria bacterium]
MESQALPKLKTAPSAKNQLEALRVLVVDDEAVIRETLSSYLYHLGVRHVDTADNGKRAIELLQTLTYDYVFMDLMMPEMDGMEVLTHLSKSGTPTSVIIMTGYPSMEKVIEAMRYGASDFLIKPFRLQDVKISMERIHRLHALMEKNWALNQELEQKKQVEKLNDELQKKIKEKTLLYEIIDALSQLNRSEDLYSFLVTKASEACNAEKACLLVHDPSKSSLFTFTHHGVENLRPGKEVSLFRADDKRSYIDTKFIDTYLTACDGKSVLSDRTCRFPDLISVPVQIRGELFGILLVARKKDRGGFDRDDEFILNFLAEKAALNVENMALYHNLKENMFATLASLVSAIEARDRYTQQHSERVTHLALEIAYELKCHPDELRKIESAGPLHDMGKIGIDDHILKKPGRLTAEEFEVIKTHPIIGVNIVSHLQLDDDQLAIIRNHHERWNGTGYPDGLKGEEIPKLARILSVADAFDAMNSDRAYRHRLTSAQCLEELEKNAGTQFDPEIVSAALRVLKF